jgi:hypothetical protein
MAYTPLRRRLFVANDSGDLYYYDLETNAWVEFETANGDIVFHKRGCVDDVGNVLFPNSGDDVYETDLTATKDDTTAITTSLKSGKLDLDSPGVTKLIRRVILDVEWDAITGQNPDVTVTLYDELGNSQNATLTLGAAGGSGTDRVKLSFPVFNAKTVQYMVSDNGKFDLFELHGIGFVFIERRIF